MGIMEIILIVLGLIVFVGSFLLPAGKKSDSQDSEKISEDTIREMVGKEVEDAKSQINDIVDETITYAMEKTERSMDRLTNEKMMAVNEYSDTVLEEINKNHKEVVFLYDMLNDKHENLKSTVSEAAKTVSEVKQTVKDAEVLAKEVESISKDTEPLNKEQESISGKPMDALNDAADNAKEIALEGTDFTPIEPVRVETKAWQPEMQPKEQESKAGGNERKTRAARAAKKDTAFAAPEEKTEREEKSVGDAAEVPEVEVTLNPAGRAGGRNSNERILELHKAGKSNMAIARELGLGIGEVKLVIDLFEGL